MSKLDALFDAVKNVDLRDVLPRIGYEVERSGKLKTNPMRDEKTVSIVVNARKPSQWTDFGIPKGLDGHSGDLIDFLRRAENLTPEDARRRAAEVLNVDIGTPHPPDVLKRSTAKNEAGPTPELPPVTPKNYAQLVDQAHAALVAGQSAAAKRALEFLRTRGFDTSVRDGEWNVITHARLGVIDNTVKDHGGVPDAAGRIVLPYLDELGWPEFLNARHPSNDQDRRYRYPSGARRTAPFGWHALGDADFVVITEGEFDALAILEATRGRTPAIATGGSSGTDDMHRLIAQTVKKALLLFDADDAGRQATEAAHVALTARGVVCRDLTLPNGMKDPNEALTRLGHPELRRHLEAEIDRALKDIAAAALERISDIKFVQTAYLEELKHRHERPFAAYPTGIDKYDKLIGGGYSEGVHLLVGGTGRGKTAFALNVAQKNALRGRHVLFLTYEMSAFELWNRLVSSILTVPAGDLKRGVYRDPQYDQIIPAHEYLPSTPAWATVENLARNLRVIEAGDALSRTDSEYTLDAARQLAEDIKQQTGAPPLVICDYVQRIPAPPNANRDPRERVDYVVGYLQVALARGVGAPVLALSSISRAFYNIDPKDTSIDDLLKAGKESGGLEFTAATVTVLHGYPKEPDTGNYKAGIVPAGFDPGASKRWVPLGVALAKNREGPTQDGGGLPSNPVRWYPANNLWDDQPETPQVRW